MAGAFTLAFSYYAGLEGITYGKVLGILACFLGAVCVGLNDTDGSDGKMQTMEGDVVAFFGAVGYGLYTTIIRYKVRLCVFSLDYGVLVRCESSSDCG